MSYDLTQTLFLLSMAANRSSVVQSAPGQNPKPANPSDLQQFFSLALNNPQNQTLDIYVKDVEIKNAQISGFFDNVSGQLAGGTWDVVWGPQVFSNPNNKDDLEADNALYVAHNATLDMWVVAIAATNMSSTYDWEDEDFSVRKMVNFPFDPTQALEVVSPDAGVAQVTQGTALGVSILLSQMPDPTTGDSLGTFLTNLITTGVATSASNLIFTGHSLAGALSPTTALLLQPTLAAAGWTNIYVLPTAGATPGNAVFVDQFTSTFKPTAATVVAPNIAQASGNIITTLNQLYWNQDDVVPRAWTQLTSYLTYTPGRFAGHYNIAPNNELIELLFGAGLKAALATAQSWGTSSNLQQLTNNTSFTATFPVTYWDGSTTSWAEYSPPTEIFGVDGLLQIIAQVHIGQYFQPFNLTPKDYLPPLPTTKTPDEFEKLIALLKRLFGLGIARYEAANA